VGTVRNMLIRQRQAPPGQITQPGTVSEDLNATRTVPDQDIAALGLDNHSPGGVIYRYSNTHLGHACILRHDGNTHPAIFPAPGDMQLST
jgi:hypothetical protein